jgi:hypothetical protein
MLGIIDHPAQQSNSCRSREKGHPHQERTPHDNRRSNNSGDGSSCTIKSNQTRGVFVCDNINKGMGINSLTKVPSFLLKGQNGEVCLKFASHGCCTYDGKYD